MSPVASRRRLLAAAALPAALGAPSLSAREPKPIERTGGPFVPTPWPVVDAMLKMGGVTARDFVMDLGSGDGRLVIAAAQRFGASGMGVDIDPELVRLANASAKKEGVADRVRFETRDIFDTDVSPATLLTLYLLPQMMLNLRPKLLAELRPGSRIVSHDYTFGEWRADQELTFDVPEKKAITGVPSATVLLYIVPARVDGRWRVAATGVPAFDRLELTIRQQFQSIHGQSVLPSGRARALEFAMLRGDSIRFGVMHDAKGGLARFEFRGRASRDEMTGSIEIPGGGVGRFVATRVKG
jgi:SAM-dependent methyltransferase